MLRYMKRSLLIVLALFLTTTGTINAQRMKMELTGSLKEMAQAGRARIEVDYSEAMIHGMSEDEFGVYEPDYFVDKDVIEGKFLGMLADGIGDFIVGTKVKSDYLISVKVIQVNPKGNHVCDVFIIRDNGSGEPETMATIKTIKADGGTFGTKLNLMKDGAEHTGYLIGKYLRAKIKKELK